MPESKLVFHQDDASSPNYDITSHEHQEERFDHMKKLILSFCDHTGNWASGYTADSATYDVIKFDLLDGHDVRLLPYIDRQVHGILAAPPCTHFSSSGSQYWERKGDAAIIEGMQIVDACLRAVSIYTPVWWALENPVGRLKNWIGPWSWTFNPCDFGGYLQPGQKSLDWEHMPAQDAYTKRTCIWGSAIRPVPKPVTPQFVTYAGKRFSPVHAHSFGRADLRSATPLGFAQAFKEANP